MMTDSKGKTIQRGDLVQAETEDGQRFGLVSELVDYEGRGKPFAVVRPAYGHDFRLYSGSLTLVMSLQPKE